MQPREEGIASQRLASGVEATTGYNLRAPSPPYIAVPLTRFEYVGDDDDEDVKEKTSPLDLQPTQEASNNLDLTPADLHAIVGDRRQSASNSHQTWSYEDRRRAHAILDFLYVGPSSIVRDHSFLKQEGITMILVANGSRLPGQKLRSIESVGEALGIQIAYLDPEPSHQQVSAFNETLRIINQHMLARPRNGPTEAPRGKVLLVCETGNDRSGAIAAAYIMAMYSRDMFDVTRYILSRRLSCGYDDNNKRALQTWGDILQAQNAVASQPAAIRTGDSARAAKRAFAQTIEVEMEDSDDVATPQSHDTSDQERFEGREAFVPFRNAS